MSQLPKPTGITSQSQPGGCHSLIECLDVGIDAVAQVPLPQFPPEPLGRIQFRGIGGQKQQGQVVGNHQGRTAMPAGTIQHQQRMHMGRQRLAEAIQLTLHRLGVGTRHQPAVALARSRTHGPKQINEAILGLPRGSRPATGIGPEPAIAALLAKAGLILKPEFDLPVRMGRLYCR
jgi:hypothetical protein